MIREQEDIRRLVEELAKRLDQPQENEWHSAKRVQHRLHSYAARTQ